MMPSRTLKPLSDDEALRLEAVAAAIDAERHNVAEFLREAAAAASEPTFSGQLRRAIHSVHQQQMLLPTLLERADVTWEQLEPFLRGQTPLPSDVIDRLVAILGLSLQSVTAPRQPADSNDSAA